MRQDIEAAIDRYVAQGVPTGDFLRAVLSNDLMEAFGRADEDNARDMREIVAYVYNDIPGNCHGSPAIVDAWIKRKREEREAKEEESPIKPGFECDYCGKWHLDGIVPGGCRAAHAAGM